MLVSSSIPNKKRKRKSGPDGIVKSKKRSKACDIPELILCADQLKSDVKEETIVFEPVIHCNLKHEPTEYIAIKSEPVDDNQGNHQIEKPAKNKTRKKKKKSSVKDVELTFKETKSEDSSIITNGLLKEEFSLSSAVKEEPMTPEKPILTVEPSNIGSLFKSNIKQELEEVDDAVVDYVSKMLSYKSTDTCIKKYQTNLHCAIPPQFVTNIQNGIKVQLATLHLKYLESEQGVLLKCSHIKLSERTASIVSISPELHFDVSCSVTIFKPILGAVLEGNIVKLGPGFVNCLVYGYFTAVVYDRFSKPVEVGSVIRFKLQFYQVTVHNDFILKGVPVT